MLDVDLRHMEMDREISRGMWFGATTGWLCPESWRKVLFA